MKVIKFAIKSLLFYTTIIATILFVFGIDSIYDKGYLLGALAIIAVLISACCIFINKKEIDILLFTKHFEEFDDI